MHDAALAQQHWRLFTGIVQLRQSLLDDLVGLVDDAEVAVQVRGKPGSPGDRGRVLGQLRGSHRAVDHHP